MTSAADQVNSLLTKSVAVGSLVGGEARGISYHGDGAVDAALQPGEKFVLLAGHAHNQTHVGLDRGVPGFSQLYSIPEIRISGSPGAFAVEVGREDTSKRTAAT